MTFSKDLDFGKVYEKKFLEYIDNYDEAIQAPDKRFPDWDWNIRRGETWTKYEVKSDRVANRTGNFFIEFRCSNKPSGIDTTMSDYYYIFVVDGDKLIDVYEIPTETLKEMCRSGKYGTRCCYNEGSNKSEGYIIPIKEIF
jgi:hypothetical protein